MKNLIKNCSCGKEHSIKTQKIIVQNDCFEEFLSFLFNSKYKKILIFYSLNDFQLINEIKQYLTVKEIVVFNIQNVNLTTKVVENLEDKGQDLVVAIGNESIISIAKYYAYMFENDVVIYPVGEFVDFTFSKFARLNDGVFFDFYLTEEPLAIFVDTNVNKYNELQTNYISFKYIALFDKIVGRYVFGCRECNKIKEFLKDNLNNYYKKTAVNEIDVNIKNIWFLIRLGQAMSFFSQANIFFGGDKPISDFLQSQYRKISFLEAEVVASKLVINLYSFFYKEFPVKGKVNLNLHLKRLTQTLKISPTMVIGRLAPSKFIVGDASILSNFSNYFFYLKSVFKKCHARILKMNSNINSNYNVIKEYDISKDKIEKSFALSSSIYHTPCTLHLLSSYGYLDKLL